ncbi:GNAT family N-acetyltransferase [Phormidium sp. CCY1219]|uniref:GNAT family N-acetyltransferase n=1 Tax=Phormidium sp. CCY1219 TaxID=2886104 RepID=UPI002D1EE554|nr:GNAT family N-acetyltransferase [Phormidium sp. CCY1219]MEB3830671.1 GNAT family N-acetyltransferase [Phormidium sp. CCY1219]
MVSDNTNLQIMELPEVKHPDFEGALQIYLHAFPASERQPTAVVKNRLKKQLYQWLIGKLENKVVCIALLYPLKNTDFVLLDYLGTDKAYRGRGIGGQFMGEILQNLANINKYLLIEVEHPASGENQTDRKRRVKFYQRLGAKILKNVPYQLPPFSGNVSIEMLLMMLPEYPGGQLPGSLVKQLIQQIYGEVYDRDAGDALLKSFIHQVPDSVELI